MSHSRSRKVLILTTYPLVDPKHGGQVRAKSLQKALVDAGFVVTTIAYVDIASNEQLAPKDKVFPKVDLYDRFDGEYVPFINDLQISKYVKSNDVFREFLLSVEGSLDVIHVEQPWLWPLASRYKKEVNQKCRIVYGSQNIESKLKIEILESLTGDYYRKHFDNIEAEIAELERIATKEADILVAVSQSELEAASAWGTSAIRVLAPNGVEPFVATSEDIEKWKEKLPGSKFLLYAASAHPPNFVKFSEVMGGSLGCFPPDSRLVVVGSVGEHIYHQATLGRFGSVNISRLELVYQIPIGDLAALKSLCSGFLLPIPYGGGTNLKTAEALQSGKPVIGTREAFRGFEAYLHLPNVHVADSPSQMHEAVRSVLTSSGNSDADLSVLEELSWSSCFAPLIEAFELSLKENSH